jgi:hypothetical protein
MRQVETEREVTVGRVMGDNRWERSDGKEMKTTGEATSRKERKPGKEWDGRRQMKMIG